jgi:Glycosyltransferase WbsX
MVVHRSADQYAALVTAAKRFLWLRHQDPAVIFLSCWNEWAENHYLLPDRAYGDSYLKAVRTAIGQ